MKKIMDTKIRLKEILNISGKDHMSMILLESTFKKAHIYCIINNIASQKYGLLLEKYIITKYKYNKNNSKNCNGDCSKNQENVEIKVSLGGAMRNKFNFVQIRLSHNISFYLFTAYHLTKDNVENNGELYIFKIPKTHLIDILVNHGSYSHGTIKEHGKITLSSLLKDDNVEYSIRTKFYDKCWKKLLNYRIPENNL
jgi:hypothetical protein